MNRFPLLPASLCIALLTPCAYAQTKPLTVKAIFHDPIFTADAPSGMSWSPDSQRMTYLNGNGDLMSVNDAGQISMLVSKTKIGSMRPQQATEEALDHRNRYNEASYLWAPDSKHLLFDKNGALFLYTPQTGVGVSVAETSTTSGDDPKFAPDGSAITYIRDHNLYLSHLPDSQTPLALTRSPSPEIHNGEVDWLYLEELDVRSNYFWSPDSKSVAYLQMNEAAVPQYPITDWMPLHATVETQRYPQPGDPNPSVRVGVVNVHSLHTRFINVPLAAGNDYIPRFGWVDAHTVWVETLSRDHQHRRLYFANAESGKSKLVLDETDPKFFDESYDVTIDGSNILWTSWRDGHTQIYLYTFDPKNPMATEAKLARELTHGDGEVFSVEGVNAATQTVLFISNQGDAREQQLWSVKLDGTDQHPVTQAHGVHHPTVSPDLKLFADDYSNISTLPRISLCTVAGDTCHALWQMKEDPAYRRVWPKMLTLKAADGTTVLYASLMLPPGDHVNGTVPLINNPYGGPHAQTVLNAWSGRSPLFDQVLATHGFAVLHVDNRGMGGRGRDFAQAAYRDFGPVQLKDQLAAIDQVLAQYPELNSKRLGWWGWSWGGTFTLYALTHSDRFTTGISVAPVTNWRLYDSTYTERYLGEPSQDEDGFRDFSVINSADQLHGRLLMVHGTGDDNVHVANTIQFVQKLIDADKPYDLQLYPRKTHSIAGPVARTHLYERILSQFEQYLGSQSGSETGAQ